MLHGGALAPVQSASLVQLPAPLLQTLLATRVNPGAVAELSEQSFAGSIAKTVVSKPMSFDVPATGLELRVSVMVMLALPPGGLLTELRSSAGGTAAAFPTANRTSARLATNSFHARPLGCVSLFRSTTVPLYPT